MNYDRILFSIQTACRAGGKKTAVNSGRLAIAVGETVLTGQGWVIVYIRTLSTNYYTDWREEEGLFMNSRPDIILN